MHAAVALQQSCIKPRLECLTKLKRYRLFGHSYPATQIELQKWEAVQHAGPLLTGHDSYEGMNIKDRKGYLTMFFQLLQHLPIRYATFVYRRSELAGDDAFVSRMRRDIVDLVFDNLE